MVNLFFRSAAYLLVWLGSISLLITAEGSDATSSQLAWSAASSKGIYRVRVSPVAPQIPIGKHHQWIAQVVTPEGATVKQARLSIRGGMPAHGHGMPSQPMVTAEPRAGHYLVEGMQFSMHGAWTLTIVIQASAGRDTVSIPLTIGY